MKLARILALLTFTLPVLAHAHPGHDGHELTWDFTHLAAHPIATLGCFGVLAVAGWGLWKLARSRRARE